MTTQTVYKACMNYLANTLQEPISYWKITDKSLVYYLMDENGRKGRRVIVSLETIA